MRHSVRDRHDSGDESFCHARRTVEARCGRNRAEITGTSAGLEIVAAIAGIEAVTYTGCYREPQGHGQ